jgi:orotate phosphoribosyltransferase-like protein
MFSITVRKKGMSTVEFSNEYNINQQSAWLFKRKAQEAMKSSDDHLHSGKVEVDELLIGGPEKK